MPAAEVDISLDLVRRLLAEQHSDLSDLPLAVLANGWDNVICELGDALLIRLPRRAVAADLVLNEQHWLPVLAPRLPLAVPAPTRIGAPTDYYPWAWSILPKLPGEPAARKAPLELRDAATTLGGFLGALHTPAPPEAPANPVRGVPLAHRAEAVSQNVEAASGLIDRHAVTRLYEAAVAAPQWHGPPVWLHGDLHPANILVDQGRISGVIDFGDITAGDPAADLSVAWMMLPATEHRAFHDAYGAARGADIDPDSLTRARGWALVLSLAFIAHSADNPLMADIGRRAMDAVIR